MLNKTKIVAATMGAAALGLAGCGQGGGGGNSATPAPSGAAQQAQGLARAAGGGAEVQNIMPGGVMITATLPSPDKADYGVQGDRVYVDETAILAKHLAQAVQDGAGDLPDGADKLSLVVLRPDLDRLGKPAAYSFMTLEFAVADLKAARIKTLGAFGVLNLATAVQVVLPWQTAVKPWCTYHDAAPEFCLRAQASVADGLW